jgi:hypothetical protein
MKTKIKGSETGRRKWGETEETVIWQRTVKKVGEEFNNWGVGM